MRFSMDQIKTPEQDMTGNQHYIKAHDISSRLTSEQRILEAQLAGARESRITNLLLAADLFPDQEHRSNYFARALDMMGVSPEDFIAPEPSGTAEQQSR